jgi:nitrogen fixation NifU-like protein
MVLDRELRGPCTMHPYSATLIDHFRSPRNVGDLEPCDGMAEETKDNVVVRVSVRVSGDTIDAVAFRSSTCVTMVAASSRLTEMATGLAVGDALAITPEMLASDLEQVPAHRRDRCELAVSVLRAVLAQASRRGSTRQHESQEATR